MRTTAAAALLLFSAASANAESILGAPDGWRVTETDKDYASLLADLKTAVTEHKMGIVTEAGPTDMAASRGEIIPGNRVIGIFRNDFAVDIIRIAPAAMIEAPIRMMVIEEPDGTATLAYKHPSVVFAPYAAAGGAPLKDAAAKLDVIFDDIADDATGN